MSTVDQILAEKEERAARRYSAAELDKMALQAENEARIMRGEPPVIKGVGNMADEEAKKAAEEEKVAKQMERQREQALALITAGVDPKQIGAMLMGGFASPQMGYPPVQQGMDIKDIIAIINLMDKRGEGSKVDATIERLERKIEKLMDEKEKDKNKDKPEPVDPLAPVNALVEWRKALMDLGVVVDPRSVRTAPATGESIEVIKEKNRHDEKMEEVKATREYHDGLVQLGASIPDRIGRGAAQEIRESMKSSSSAKREQGNNNGKGKLETMKCGDCGNMMIITPETKLTITCSKCGSIWDRTPVDNIPI